jgi:hypothetical protein
MNPKTYLHFMSSTLSPVIPRFATSIHDNVALDSLRSIRQFMHSVENYIELKIDIKILHTVRSEYLSSLCFCVVLISHQLDLTNGAPLPECTEKSHT